MVFTDCFELEAYMNTKRFIICVFAIFFLFTGCVPHPAVSPSAPAPTATAMHLSPLYKLTMFVGGRGWASNLDQTKFFNTINFGEHFLNVTPPGFDQNQFGSANSSFPSGEIGWLCQSSSDSSATLFSTSDGGRNWQSHKLSFPCGQLSFLNAQEGYVLSDQGVAAGSQYVSLYYTSDGGNTWQLRFNHDPSSADVHGLPTGGIKATFVFLSDKIGLVAGSEPVPGLVYLFRTDNGGISWKSSECAGVPLDTTQETSVDTIVRLSATSAILPIRSYIANGNSVTYFCSTTDAGKNWAYTGMLEGVEFFDFGTLQTGVAFSQGKMFKTEDGGATWTETTSGLPPAVIPVAVDMVNDKLGFLTATITPDTLTDNRIYMTGNNGKDWQPMPGNIIEGTSIGLKP